jgi:hypothetical protein
VSCRWCGESAVGNWLIFDFGRVRRRRPSVGRYILKMEFCEPCVALVLERATPTDRPHIAHVPPREWPRWAARASAAS